MDELEVRNNKALRLFLIITISLSIVWETIIIMIGMMTFAAFLMWTPAVGAFITKKIYFKDEKGVLRFHLCKIKYIVAAILIPLIYIGVPYVIYWIVFPRTLDFHMSLGFWLILILGIPVAMVTALGEEIGWRGFMVPAFLKKMGLEQTLILSGVIWGLWHMPLLISNLYMTGTPIWYKVPMFFLVVVAMGSIIGILTIESKSIWPAAIMHAAHNSFDQAVFGLYTVGENKMYFISETGIFTVIMIWIIAIVLYIRIKKQRNEKR